MFYAYYCFMVFSGTVWEEACEQLHNLLQVTSTICSQARTTAIAWWSPSLLSQTGLWTPVTHLHLPSQHPKLGVRSYSCLPQQQICLHLCPSSSRHWICVWFCFLPGWGHTRRHLGVSHSSQLPLECKVRGYQSCHTLAKMGHIQKREHVSFISYPTSFGY